MGSVTSNVACNPDLGVGVPQWNRGPVYRILPRDWFDRHIDAESIASVFTVGQTEEVTSRGVFGAALGLLLKPGQT